MRWLLALGSASASKFLSVGSAVLNFDLQPMSPGPDGHVHVCTLYSVVSALAEQISIMTKAADVCYGVRRGQVSRWRERGTGRMQG